MCLGTPSNDAAKEAQRAEDQRRAQVQQTQGAIEKAYSTPERAAQIEDLIAATRDFLSKDLKRQNEGASRNLKFSMARNGTTLGSVEKDGREDIGRAFLRGSLETERRAQGAGASLRQSDLDAKMQLFNQAAAGLNMNTALMNAGSAQRASLGLAKADATQSGLGDLFSSFAEMAKASKEAKGRMDAEKYQYGGGQYYTPNALFAPAPAGR